MLNIFWRNLKDKKWSLMIYCAASVIFLWMYVALFPSMQKSSGNITEIAKVLPEGLMKAFGLDINSIITFDGFIAGKHYSLVWPILLIALEVSLGSAFLAGEIEKGTIGVLLSQPISRVKIFFSKLLVGTLSIIIFIIFSILSIFPLASLYDISYKGENYLKLSLVGLTFGLAKLGLSMFFSTIFSEKGKTTFAVIGILIAMYFMNIIALLKDNLDKVKYFSFFYYFNYSEILNNGKIDNWSFWIFLGTFFVCGLAGLIWFKKRNVNI